MNLSINQKMTTESDLISLLNEQINNKSRFILSTHKNSDGDGIGSAVALYWALMQKNCSARFCHVDQIPSRYHFLLKNTSSFQFNTDNYSDADADILLITDTNQGSLCDPLYSYFKKNKKKIIFIDHHLPSDEKNMTENYYIREDATSTGEVIYDILKKLETHLTPEISTALYTSITFDTQAFKLLRNSSRSHEIAAILAKDNIHTDKIQRELFATWTVQKMNFLASLIQNAKYSNDNTIVGFTITQAELQKYNLELDQINEIIDMFTLIKSICFCYSIIEISELVYKTSFRSIETNKAFIVAEFFGGGGHAKSSGAWIKNQSALEIENKILSLV